MDDLLRLLDAKQIDVERFLQLSKNFVPLSAKPSLPDVVDVAPANGKNHCLHIVCVTLC